MSQPPATITPGGQEPFDGQAADSDDYEVEEIIGERENKVKVHSVVSLCYLYFTVL